MNPFQFGFPAMDPSKMDPKVMMEISQLIQKLPPEQLQKIQSMMHNMQAGFDVRKEAEELEKSLPPEFRAKMLSLMSSQLQGSGTPDPVKDRETTSASQEEMDMRQARLTVLRAVSAGSMSPEEAERILFPEANL